MRESKAILLACLAALNSAKAEKLSAVPINPEFSYQTSKQLFESHLIADTSPFRVWYASEKSSGRHQIQSRFLYRKYLDEGLPVVGVNYYVGDPFRWAAPSLSIQISNTTKRTIELVGANFDVEESILDSRAIPVFHAFSNINILTIDNFGWGDMKDVSLKYGIVDTSRCESAKDEGGQPIELRERKFNSIADSINIDLSKEIPAALKQSVVVCVVGLLGYRDVSGTKYTIPYATGVNLVSPGPGAPSPPTAEYVLELQVGKVGRRSVSIAQQVRPNDVDHFLVRVVSDKSARYKMKASVLNTEGADISAGAFDLTLFVPRGRQSRPSYDAFTPVPRSVYATEDIHGYISQISRNPKRSSEIAIVPTKSYFLASAAEREAVISKVKNALQDLHENSLYYCIIRDSKCIESGSMSWAN